jgi:hypothetical protein
MQRGDSSSIGPRATPTVLELAIQPQPDDATCGPTCLHAVYRYYADDVSLTEVIATTPQLPGEGTGRGTLAVMLGIHALRRGYDAALCTFNLQMFDPTWFGEGSKEPADSTLLASKLRAQAGAKGGFGPKLQVATGAYLEFLSLGGTIWLRDLSSTLIAGFIRQRKPILTGLSATYLYRCAREYGPNDDFDDVRGEPAGHFVILHGYDPAKRLVTVSDPLEQFPGFSERRYTMPMARLIAAIMLGVITYDANLLIIEPRKGMAPAEAGER